MWHSITFLKTSPAPNRALSCAFVSPSGASPPVGAAAAPVGAAAAAASEEVANIFLGGTGMKLKYDVV